MLFTKNSKSSDKITLWRWFLYKFELYFVSYSSRSITCVFDINEPKSYKNGSKVSLWPHILTQFDYICRLVYDLTIYNEFLLRLILTWRNLYVKKSLFFYLSVIFQITHQLIDLVKLSMNVRSKWYFWPIWVWYGLFSKFFRIFFYSERSWIVGHNFITSCTWLDLFLSTFLELLKYFWIL